MAMYGHFQPNGETFIVIPTTGGLFSHESIARQVYRFYATQSPVQLIRLLVLVAPFHHWFFPFSKVFQSPYKTSWGVVWWRLPTGIVYRESLRNDLFSSRLLRYGEVVIFHLSCFMQVSLTARIVDMIWFDQQIHTYSYIGYTKPVYILWLKMKVHKGPHHCSYSVLFHTILSQAIWRWKKEWAIA